MRLLFISFLLLLQGCAANYNNGFTNVEINDDVTRVRFDGKRDNSVEGAYDYMFMKATEIGVDKKHEYFYLYPTLNAVAKNQPHQKPLFGNYGQGFYFFMYVRTSNEEQENAFRVTDAFEKYKGAILKRTRTRIAEKLYGKQEAE